MIKQTPKQLAQLIRDSNYKDANLISLYLDAIQYGNKRDYTKIRFNSSGLVTTWAKDLFTAKVAMLRSNPDMTINSIQFDKD